MVMCVGGTHTNDCTNKCEHLFQQYYQLFQRIWIPDEPHCIYYIQTDACYLQLQMTIL